MPVVHEKILIEDNGTLRQMTVEDARGQTGPQGPQGPQGPAGAQGQPGTDGRTFVFRGVWEAATVYARDEVVHYDGSTWIAIANPPTVGSAPAPGSTNWDEMALQGIAGPQGPQGLQGDQHVFVQATEPANPQPDWVWVKTSVDPPEMYVFIP